MRDCSRRVLVGVRAAIRVRDRSPDATRSSCYRPAAASGAFRGHRCHRVAITAQFESLLVMGSRSRAPIPRPCEAQTRWQLYCSACGRSRHAVRMELRALNDPWALGVLIVNGSRLSCAGTLRGLPARRWTMPPESELDDADPEALTFLNLGPGAGHNPQPAI